jgi:hypothetical protein
MRVLRRTGIWIAFGLLMLPACSRAQPVRPSGSAQSAARPILTRSSEYEESVQPILERRCVVCHACYDSPCQLNLQSFDGLDRGANKAIVYQPERLSELTPTRMFVDADGSEAWQSRFGFFPVLEREPGAARAQSLLLQLVLARSRERHNPRTLVDDANDCPRNRDEAAALLKAHPDYGMPFGFPALGADEAAALEHWVSAGSPGPTIEPDTTPSERAAIAEWEAFLNADDIKTRIVARYVYEHLFLAHLGFDIAPGHWYRLVRSKRAAPADIAVIATTRPYDDPGVARVYYRLQRLRESIVLKTHIPYQLSAAKLNHLRELFLASTWPDAAPQLPAYTPEVAANPFLAFRAIPARARYQFMLDDAYYHVATFIHGPVCKGQVALDVIDEQFLIFFLAPQADRSIADPAYLSRAAENLALPAQGGDGIEAVYARFKFRELGYLRNQAAALNGQPGRTYADIWDGDGQNPDAVLTVYRNYDSAFVLRGAHGGVPKTAWVVDYPIFERIYYDLVAGFDVFGNLVHQIATRRYMNLLRIESEDQFLRFMPAAARKSLRDYWYRGTGVATLVDVFDPFYGGPEPRIQYGDAQHAKAEFITHLLTRVLPREVVGSLEPIQWPSAPLPDADAAAQVEAALREIVNRPAPFVQAFPDSTLLRVRLGAGSDDHADLIYSVLRNRAHLNIDFMFRESAYLVPQEDTLHVVRGVAASRPNLFLRVSLDHVDVFLTELRGLRADPAAFKPFFARYGVGRDSDTFWSESDFFNDESRRRDAFHAGVLDLSRYAPEP